MHLFSPLYIQGMAQISIQPPLGDDWMHEATPTNEAYTRANDPVFRDFLSPLEARRMGKLLKRAAIVSERALQEGNTACPENIYTGTGLGCVESTEEFLEKLCRQGEHLLSPSHFMQSTHNTISSLIAIRTHCHGCNMTFSHKTFSFEQALNEALMSHCCEASSHFLIGGYDEVTPSYFTLLRRAGYVGNPGQVSCSETAMAALLSTTANGALARLEAFGMGQRANHEAPSDVLRHFLTANHLSATDIDAILTGANGVPANDNRYASCCAPVCPNVPQLAYKSVFGENYTVSALGFYAAVRMLQHAVWPQTMRVVSGRLPQTPPRRLLLMNLDADGGYALTMLSSIS